MGAGSALLRGERRPTQRPPALPVRRLGRGALAARRRPERRGLFVLAEAAGERRGWIHERLILPVADCNDPALRGALAEAAMLLSGDGPADGLAVRRRRAEARLANTGLPAGPVPEGFVELAPLHRLFALLHRAFRYVSELSDDPTGAVTESRLHPNEGGASHSHKLSRYITEYVLPSLRWQALP